MYLADYHTHSKYSFDGSEELETMCETAINRGLSEIAVTDHMDIFHDLPYGQMINFDEPGGKMFYMKTGELYSQLKAVQETYAGRLKVKIGCELGQPQVNPESAKAFIRDYGPDLDFIIGSVHNLEGDLDVYYYDFDGMDIYAMYDHYVDWLIDLARTGDFDVMGHLTYPLRYMFERRGIRMTLERYEEKFRYLFRILRERGKGIEMNVSGMYKPMKDTMPPRELLKLYRECGGEIITIGSDAHKAEFIGLWQQEGQALLQELGFKYITVYTKRKPEFVTIE